MKAMFLCAGLGNRLRPYTTEKAKPAIPFLGIPLMHHVWHSLNPNNLLSIDELIVNHHHRSQDIISCAQLLSADTKETPIRLSDERELLLDSGGGLHNAEKYLKNEKCFLLANGDEVFFLHDSSQVKEFKARHLFKESLATLLVTQNPEVGKTFGGAYADANHNVKIFSKTLVPGLEPWHYMGAMLLSPRIFEYMKPPTNGSSIAPENILYDTITNAIAAGEKVEVFPVSANWYEVGNPKSFLEATEEICELLNSSNLTWVDLLRQRIRWAYLMEPFIEKSDIHILKKVEETLAALKSIED